MRISVQRLICHLRSRTSERGPPAVLPDLEQAQRAVFERQEADDLLFDTLLFDTPYTLEDPEDQEIGEVQEKPTSECPAVTYCQDGELSFHAYDRGNWSRTDTVRKNARFCDSALRKVAVAECVRKAINFMRFGRDLSVARHLSGVHNGLASHTDASWRSSDCAGRTTAVFRPYRLGALGRVFLVLHHHAYAPSLTAWVISI
ncbi:uncharacterized protein P174DRAFT_417188 [Aspergillus novofumigatus IBT 16806]|uniref:Uncharacterized protein n=1 Tax=Aspergillus novofumigatus (strain IBT 16806) TaxID=1392255 RepID=A0A2I1CPJ9_ASPN1|nr:uncharacterized protein P174DRAFT_417188 [Aspergillus novofumigatus IBT 16806]PKX99528.1 hypothetical protein P174DRAFT_417188 [Aspergillus novofumigatus IBT 16806]